MLYVLVRLYNLQIYRVEVGMKKKYLKAVQFGLKITRTICQ